MNKTIHDYIRDLCRGYHDRRREIEKGDKGRPRRAAMIAEYMRLNSAIDTALLIIEEKALCLQVRESLINGVGFEALFEPLCGRNQFYNYKRSVFNEIARQLHLIE